MIIGVISDMHLGYRQYGSLEREEEFYNQYLKCMEKLSEEDIDLLIIAGDLFDKPNPSPKAMRVYDEGLRKLDGVPVVAIKGNHTMLMRENHYCVDNFFADYGKQNYFLLDDETIDNELLTQDLESPLGAIVIDGLTYRTDSDLNTFLELHKKMAYHTSLKASDNAYKVLVVHQAFKEFCGFTGADLSINDLDLSVYDLIICGHIHSRLDQRLGRTLFIQPGSLERMNTAEALDEQENGKGYYLINTDGNNQVFVQVESDRKFLLGYIEFKSENEIEKHFVDLENEINKMNLPPIISYNYYDSTGNINYIRELMKDKTKGALINNSNIYDMTEEDISVEIKDNEMPTILDVLQQKNLNETEVVLANDVYETFKDSDESLDGFLDNYFENNFEEKYEDTLVSDKELEDLEMFFENLGGK